MRCVSLQEIACWVLNGGSPQVNAKKNEKILFVFCFSLEAPQLVWGAFVKFSDFLIFTGLGLRLAE